MHNKVDLLDLKNRLLTLERDVLLDELEYIHPVDILSVLHDFPDDEEAILNRLPDETIALLLDFEEDENKYELLTHFSSRRQKNI